jgi:hypothetical protein
MAWQIEKFVLVVLRLTITSDQLLAAWSILPGQVDAVRLVEFGVFTGQNFKWTRKVANTTIQFSRA